MLDGSGGGASGSDGTLSEQAGFESQDGIGFFGNAIYLFLLVVRLSLKKWFIKMLRTLTSSFLFPII